MHIVRGARSGRAPEQERPSGAIPTGHKPKVLDQLPQALQSRHYSRRTEQTYCHWVRRFICFHHIPHPAEMGEPEINVFLTYLAVKGKANASTENQALSALWWLGYKDVRTTMIYTHVLNRGGRGVRSSADSL